MANTIPGGNKNLYTDLTSLSQLKADASKDGDAKLREVAQQFEQVFMNMMLKSMRQATESFSEDNPFNSSEVQFYQGMLDQQLTLELSQGNNGMGLADVIVRQLGGSDLSPETLRQAMQLPTSDDDLSQRLNQGESLNETLLNLAARRVATHSLEAVNQISSKLAATAEPEDTAELEETSEQVDSVAAAASNPAAEGEVAKANSMFDSPETFVQQVLPLAEKAAKALGVDPRVLVAQAALETGWGKSIIRDESGQSSNNLFNIKADGRWNGDSVSVGTIEYRNGLPQPEKASFRAYDSIEDSLQDYIKFLQDNPRYEQALEQAGNPVAYLQALQRAGYATDPNYAEKIDSIFRGNTLAELARQTQEG
ncbi:flagellar assembly peptidoglycan hydrolase FlgJ [Marinobacterium litorale]|uniref:flagellar assembly peptidoglycan hydrolase FlgJ n=1 Tax=Marinobacterium litorale TaxID=404770 RepID=UPI00042A5DA8|nr:flagellar assembly peptidoglycan hydrolase FlgJ [Marinobacterium litorale]